MRILLLLLLFTACSSSNEEMTSFSGRQMTMNWEVKLGQRVSKKQEKEIQEAIHHAFHTIDCIYNNWNPASEIAKVNQAKAGQAIVLSEPLANFLKRVAYLVEFTEGRFDPTIDPLQKLYKLSFAEGKRPDPTHLESLYPAIGWDKVHLEGSMLWKEHDKTSLDLSGVAKGYGVDLITEALLALGYENLYVEWGGEIRTTGSHRGKRAWRIAIMGGDVIEMGDDALATSGNYYQRWRVDGKSYTHIIDSKTKEPLQISKEAIGSAAVKCTSCAEADAIATSLMLFPSAEEARAWIQAKQLTAWIID